MLDAEQNREIEALGEVQGRRKAYQQKTRHVENDLILFFLVCRRENESENDDQQDVEKKGVEVRAIHKRELASAPCQDDKQRQSKNQRGEQQTVERAPWGDGCHGGESERVSRKERKKKRKFFIPRKHERDPGACVQECLVRKMLPFQPWSW